MSDALGDRADKTSPTWDTFNPNSISGAVYEVSASGFQVWRRIRGPAAGGALVFRCATPWKAQIPGGSYDAGTGNITKTFLASEVLDGVQITTIVKSGSANAVFEVWP